MEMNALDVLNAMKKSEELPTKTNEPEKNIPNAFCFKQMENQFIFISKTIIKKGSMWIRIFILYC
mgnify:CR=1 FL=1